MQGYTHNSLDALNRQKFLCKPKSHGFSLGFFNCFLFFGHPGITSTICRGDPGFVITINVMLLEAGEIHRAEVLMVGAIDIYFYPVTSGCAWTQCPAINHGFCTGCAERQRMGG